jgi:ABC-2 type transport system ATP-binding protein
MRKILLATKRPWNWKVFLILFGLIVLAAFAILPYSLHIIDAYSETNNAAPGWGIILRNALINALAFGFFGGIGLLLANRIGLGLPFVEGWVRRKPALMHFRSAVAIGWIAAFFMAIATLFLENYIFGPPMQELFAEIGYVTPEEATTPPLYGFLAAFSAGVTEESLFRLFGLSLLAWLGGLLFHDPDGRPKLYVLWVANIVFALAFGASHLPAAASLGWPINTLIITRTVVLSGVGGLVLGWLFWMFGLETAMLAHFLVDVVLYTLLPIIALQQSELTRNLALAGVVAVVLLAIFLAVWVLIREKNRYEPQKSAVKENVQIPTVKLVRNIKFDQAICIHELTKDFGSIRALDRLSLEIPPGSIFGFLGPNGAGKTTTIRLLLGLLEPTSGSAQVLGFNPLLQADQIRAHSGALLEHTGIYEQLSAEDNLEFYARAFSMNKAERSMRIQELLNHMGLWERRKDRAGNWSRGMKQKLALARTLLHRPNLILLDEPTAGLDVQSAVSIREDLQALASKEDVTIFLTTHNMTDAEKLCDQVAVIQDGSLVAWGSPDELRAQVARPQVEIKGRGFNELALNSLRSLPQVTSVESNNSHLFIDLRSETDTAALVSILVGAGAQVEEVQRRRASLEEVFLSLTGEGNG